MSAGIEQLPRGRHRLSREEVLTSQRGRMLRAIAEAVAEAGFAAVTVAEVIGRAGVSRETFYEQFSNKEDCFLQALDAVADRLEQVLRAALAEPADCPVARLDRVLDAYLHALAAEPALAKAYLIDAYGAGPRATARRIELQQRFVDMVAEVLGSSDQSSRFACETVVAAIASLATARVGSGRADELPGLRQPLIELIAQVFPR
jgi:AcrR family transcriptional regulator